MKQQEAKRRILAEWQALSEAEKKSDTQATAFATRILAKYPFRGSGDHCERIRNWLLFADSKANPQAAISDAKPRLARGTPPRWGR